MTSTAFRVEKKKKKVYCMLLLVLIICSLHDSESLREVYFCHKIIYCWQKDEGIATHSSTLPWKIPWMEKLGGLHSMRSLRVGHDWATSLSLFTFMHGEGNGNPLQCSAWWAAVYGVTQSRTWLSDFTFTLHFHAWRRKWQPTPVFLPGEPQGRGSLVGCCLWGRTESDTTEVT